jgi:hypothetical protein
VALSLLFGVLIVGDGLAQLALYVLILVAIVFLVGFAIVIFPSVFLIRRFKKGRLRSQFPFLALAVVASILGGLLAVRLLYAWHDAEERAFYAERRAFGQKMAQEYPAEIKYQPDRDYDQQFQLVFSVPAAGIYDLHVFGFLEGESKDYTDLRNAVVEIHNYGLLLQAGTNEFPFGFVDNAMAIETNQNIYFIVVIQPKTPREKLINTQKGIAVTNAGSVVLTDGINYYSSEFFASVGCLNNIYQWVPCIEHDQLQIKLLK